MSSFSGVTGMLGNMVACSSHPRERPTVMSSELSLIDVALAALTFSSQEEFSQFSQS